MLNEGSTFNVIKDCDGGLAGPCTEAKQPECRKDKE